LDTFTKTCHISLEREKNIVLEYRIKSVQNGEKMEQLNNIKSLFPAFGGGSGVRDTPERGRASSCDWLISGENFVTADKVRELSFCDW